jgi:hypothetical protein
MRVIILAAGQGFLLDGMVKCLIRAPHDGRALLEKAVEAFAGHRLTVVVGYRAVAVMEAFPDLDYVYNPDWATTNNSQSLGLALDDEPAYVLSSDLVFEPALVRELDAAAPDLVLTERRENRILTGILRRAIAQSRRPRSGRPLQDFRSHAPASMEAQLFEARESLRGTKPAGRVHGERCSLPRPRRSLIL